MALRHVTNGRDRLDVPVVMFDSSKADVGPDRVSRLVPEPDRYRCARVLRRQVLQAGSGCFEVIGMNEACKRQSVRLGVRVAKTCDQPLIVQGVEAGLAQEANEICRILRQGAVALRVSEGHRPRLSKRLAQEGPGERDQGAQRR